MIRNIGFLFFAMGDFNCNKSKKLFDLWDKQESVIKKRIEIIDKCLDVYDILYPYTERKPVDETGVDLNMELGCPGWLDLKKSFIEVFFKD